MFCVKCGTPAADDKTKFCPKCGAPLSAPAGSLAPREPAPVPPSASAGTPPAKSGSPIVKIVVAVLALLALVAVLGIGSCFYIGYKMKKKVTQLAQQASQQKSVEESQQPSEDDSSRYEHHPVAGCEDKDQDQADYDRYMKAAASATLPLKNGLTLVSIWTDPENKLREVEVLTTVTQIESNMVDFSQQRAESGAMAHLRSVCIADMLHGRSYESDAGPDTPMTIPGTTMFTLSRAIFDELKSGQPVNWTYDTTWDRRSEYLSDPQRGVLQRIEPNDVPYSILVNDKRIELPTIHARAKLNEHVTHQDREYEVWVLDDPANPITLNIVDKARDWHITYMKASFPVEEKKIEQDLAQNGRAEIYGIYFDFGSATLRPESAPVLKEISDALADNPSWKISIEGHTDNVGGDESNLRLSQKRAEAVLQALQTQYQIAPDRMTAQGFGALRPKAPNDTPEGRAQNRRVELVRE